MINITFKLTKFRLETRAGAEEVIERLHGRMVRGWNDTGSRISVRFADTSEQRELRVGAALSIASCISCCNTLLASTSAHGTIHR